MFKKLLLTAFIFTGFNVNIASAMENTANAWFEDPVTEIQIGLAAAMCFGVSHYLGRTALENMGTVTDFDGEKCLMIDSKDFFMFKCKYLATLVMIKAFGDISVTALNGYLPSSSVQPTRTLGYLAGMLTGLYLGQQISGSLTAWSIEDKQTCNKNFNITTRERIALL